MTRQSTQTSFFRLLARALVIIPMAGLLMAPTCDQSHSGDHDYGTTVVKYSAFGDSIPAGNLNSGSSSSSTSNYVNYYAAYAAQANGWFVEYTAKTVSGETTSQINSTMNSNSSLMAQADMFTFNAGGNDLLGAREGSGGCSDSTLTSAVNSLRSNWNNVVNTVANNVPTDALIRTMTIYYPDPNNDKGSNCSNGYTKFEMLLPHGLAASDYMCSTAAAQGWGCADALTVMNCDQDASGNADARCPNIAYLNTLAATTCPRGSNGMMDAVCIRNHLEATGDWNYFRDPTSVSKGGTLRNLVQSGDIHPNSTGHDLIAAAHHDLGYDTTCTPSCGGDQCGQSDGCGGVCASSDVGTCGMCGDPGPSCSGDMCGQSDGCDGFCPSTDGNACGKCGNPACETPDGLDEVISGASGSETHRSFDGTDPTVSISGGSGDADLYVKLGSAPTTSSYDCRPYKSGNDETCDMSGTGTWHVMVRAYSSYSNVSLVSSDGGGGGGGGGGGMCTNTCNYANDGECDDGGPGSQYSVCGLGTDCGDCGPR